MKKFPLAASAFLVAVATTSLSGCDTTIIQKDRLIEKVQPIEKFQMGDSDLSCEQLISEVEKLGGTREEIKTEGYTAPVGTEGPTAAVTTTGVTYSGATTELLEIPIVAAPILAGGYSLKENNEGGYLLTENSNRSNEAKARRDHLSTVYNQKKCISRGVTGGATLGVVRLQEALIKNGYDPGAVDGKFGSKTRRALEQFQSENKLDVTGELDFSTRALLY